MITVPEATKKIVERSRYLSEAISKGLINYSSLARYMKPEIEQMLVKDVSEVSIMMALKRLESQFKPSPISYNTIFQKKPEISTRSNLVLVSVPSHTSLDTNSILKNKGMAETTYILSQDQFDVLQYAHNIFSLVHLSAITIKLPKETLTTPGIYYFFLKSLAWEGINIVELSSTVSELTIIVEEKDIERAFSIINSLFTTIDNKAE